jgi:uncharacterized protein YkwD
VGIESLDGSGEEPRRAQRGTSQRRLVIGLIVALAFLLAVLRPAAARERGETGLRLELLPGLPAITIGETSLYPENDPWRDLLADEATCPHGEDASATPEVQVQVLLCLLNYARDQQGLGPLTPSSLLGTTASAKAYDIVLCRDFSHEACGKPAFQVADDVGYHGSIGENLYVAEGALTAPRYAVDTWLNSPPHRENLFEPGWRTIGIAMLGGANFDDIEDGVVWVNHFGP